jgi:hypothetical protein
VKHEARQRLAMVITWVAIGGGMLAEAELVYLVVRWLTSQ